MAQLVSPKPHSRVKIDEKNSFAESFSRIRAAPAQETHQRHAQIHRTNIYAEHICHHGSLTGRFVVIEQKHVPPMTEQWAQSFNISTALTPAAVPDYDEPCPFSAREIATRVIILQGVVAAACEVAPDPIVEWYKAQGVWDAATPKEGEFLLNPDVATPQETLRFRWQQEAEWALLWVIGKVQHLGLPIRQCDTRRLVNEIIPPLGSDIEPFLASAALRSPGELLAEVDRRYELWCRYFQIRREHP